VSSRTCRTFSDVVNQRPEHECGGERLGTVERLPDRGKRARSSRMAAFMILTATVSPPVERHVRVALPSMWLSRTRRSAGIQSNDRV